MTLTVTQPSNGGWLTAWERGASQPNASSLNYATNETIANTSIIPITPSSGGDFNLYSSATTHVIVDVMGYFAAPITTPLDCTVASGSNTTLPVNTWTTVSASCPPVMFAMGGGFIPSNSIPDAFSYPDLNNNSVWNTQLYPRISGISARAYARCCQLPGR